MKYFIRKEADRYRIYKLTKGARQMISINSRLYPADDELFYCDPKTSGAYVMFDIDCLQPYGHEAKEYDSEFMRIEIISAKTALTRKERWLKLDGSKIEKYLGGIILVGVLLYAFLSGMIKI